MVTETEQVKSLFQQLIVFRTLTRKRIIRELLQIAPSDSLHCWYGAILEQYPEAANPWAAFLWDAIKNDENYFSLAAERGNADYLPATIKNAVLSDLDHLAELLNWRPDQLVGLTVNHNCCNLSNPGFRFLCSGDCPVSLLWLSEWYAAHGAGDFGKYSSFIWNPAHHHFRPIANPDPITLEDLIGCDSQKDILIQNTRQFLKGLPANNVLLYGDRGTGKSSAVKGLANHFAGAGLRLIEVDKEHLSDFPELVGVLANRGLKFIIFVDDLSFEASESQYKHLKAILEGGLETRPHNLLIYATSNRRHLIRETMAEREEDLHANDTIQEKLSLADRFGITLTFTSPNQDEYLAIVRNMAAQRNLAIGDQQLTAQAIQWERFQNGRSGRTARQFVDHLQGELGLAEQEIGKTLG